MKLRTFLTIVSAFLWTMPSLSQVEVALLEMMRHKGIDTRAFRTALLDIGYAPVSDTLLEGVTSTTYSRRSGTDSVEVVEHMDYTRIRLWSSDSLNHSMLLGYLEQYGEHKLDRGYSIKDGLETRTARYGDSRDWKYLLSHSETRREPIWEIVTVVDRKR